MAVSFVISFRNYGKKGYAYETPDHFLIARLITALPYSRLDGQVSYILDLRSENKDGAIIYDTGWNNLLSPELDLYLYLSIVLLFSGIYAFEYQTA